MSSKSKILRFLVSGGLAALTEYASFLLLHSALRGGLLVLSQSLSFMAGFIVSFILNRNWVFTSSGKVKSQLVRYAILASINLALTNALLWVLIEKAHIVYWVAKFVIMAMVATWNYVLFSRLIFHEKEQVIPIV